MLVLTRKHGERLVIEGNIIIQVVEIRGSSVRLGIEAPDDTAVLRAELITGQEVATPLAASSDE
jgi:carbon storage regulator